MDQTEATKTIHTRAAQSFLAPRADADARFRDKAKRMGLDPDGVWVGGYVDWEWEHSRHLFQAISELTGNNIHGGTVLEFGCHTGATATVMALLGARVTGVDIGAEDIELARLNADRYGVTARIDFLHVPDSTTMPFHDSRFDWITCNSVLEYVDHRVRARVLRELDRVLRPGGILAITGTSNRIWPREIHSARWLVNYVPRGLDTLFGGKPRARGVSPWTLRAGFPSYEDLCLHNELIVLAAKTRMGAPRALVGIGTVASRLLRPLGISIGMLPSSVTLVLRKPVKP